MGSRLFGYVSASNTPTVVEQSAYGRATGGIGSPTAVTIAGVNYEYLTFTSTGTLTVTTAGWFDYLLVGGGGGANYRNIASRAGGGGGAGQVRIGSIYLDANQTITIGAGSAVWEATTLGQKAGDTSIAATSPFTQTASGNIQTLTYNYNNPNFSLGGGCGGINASSPTYSSYNPTGNTNIGFKGGNSTADSGAGGGGGCTSAGSDNSSNTGGAGGAGFDVSVFIGGSALYKAAGGGGGGTTAGGAGGSSGVGGAGSTNTTPTSAAANTGSGGGGGVVVITTGAGGSGIAYIRWQVA